MLVEVEGTWTGRHQFAAEKATLDLEQFSKVVHESAYLDREPTEEQQISAGQPARLKVDGELLVLDEKTKRTWPATVPPAGAAAATPGIAARQVRYEGVRRPDGLIVASEVELGSIAQPDAFKMGDVAITRASEEKTGIDILEFRKGTKVQARMKLLDIPKVQEYVRKLGHSLVPPMWEKTSAGVEFRFFVVEDPSINASALPDGTLLINTGLLGAVESEAQLAFVLSHEIAHTMQIHYWRQVHETRTKRILITIAAYAASGYIGDAALVLGQLGLEAVVNGYGRRIENQADRIGMQNIVERGYDPREAIGFSKMIIDRYGSRATTSRIWDNHEAMLLRGSFLATQIRWQYPEANFDNLRKTTPEFEAMKEALGPVKIM